jgi:hypothetical protein
MLGQVAAEQKAHLVVGQAGDARPELRPVADKLRRVAGGDHVVGASVVCVRVQLQAAGASSA